MRSTAAVWGITLLLLQPLAAYAQGVVLGEVVDAESNDPVGRATVMALGADTTGTYADLRGKFRLQLRAGQYRLRVSAVGYTAAEVQPFRLGTGDTLRFRVRLYPSARRLEGVVVEGRRERSSVESAIAERRFGAQIAEVVAQEQLRVSGDGDLGQALMRVTGVAVAEGKYVYVRGMNERYSTVLLNGLPVAMTEPDRRAVSLELFPAEVIERFSVVKASSGELPGAAGGVVDIRTLDFPEAFQLRVRLGSPYVEGLSFRTRHFRHYREGPDDWTGWDGRWRALPAMAPASRREMERLRQAAWNPFDTTGTLQRWIELGRSFNSQAWGGDSTTVGVLPALSLSIGGTLPFGESARLGTLAALSYTREANSSAIEWAGLLADRSLLFEHAGTEAQRKVAWSALGTAALEFGTTTELRWYTLLSRQLTDRFLALEGADLGYQFLQTRHFVYHLTQYELLNTQLSGRHALGASQLHWSLGYGRGRQQQPDYRRLRYQRQLAAAPDEPFFAEIPRTQQGDGTRAGRFFSDLDERLTAGELSFQVPFQLGTLQLGLSRLQRERSFSARSFTLIQAPRATPWTLDLTLPPEQLLVAENFREDGLGISEDTKLSDSYRASEGVWAGSVTARFRVNVAQIPLELSLGLRLESIRQSLSSHLINEQPLEQQQRWDNWLPSMSLLVRLSEQMQVRAAVSRTVTTPTFREVAPFAFFDVAEQALVQGNPLLKPADALSGELRWELYPDVGEMLSLGVFAKSIRNALEETIFPQQSELTRTYANSEQPARILGAEAEFRYRFGLPGSSVKQFALQGNFTLLHGRVGVRSGGLVVERQLWGQSPYALNLGLTAATPWGSELGLFWNRLGRRIVRVAQPEQYQFEDPHIYELPQDMLNLTLRQPLWAGVELGLKASNLLRVSERWEQGGRQVFQRRLPRTFQLSFGYRVQ
jgi:outer membrane receptor protein involved in Fe transport